MQATFYLSKKEYSHIINQAMLINNGVLKDDDLIVITIDDNRIAVDVPNMVRSMSRPVEVSREHRLTGVAISEPSDYEQPTDNF